MAFCNSCGANLMPGAQFCNKCGATIAGTPAAASSATPAAPAVPAPGGGGSALKVVLIIVAVVIGLGILSIISLAVFVHHFARNSRVHQEGNKVRVETPFGTVDTSTDPKQVAKDLGIDVYPGAQVQNDGAATANIGKIHTVAATFTTSDSVDKVCAFYKSRLPNTMVSSSDQNRCTYVSNDQKNMVTLNVESSGDMTRIQITNVNQKSE